MNSDCRPVAVPRHGFVQQVQECVHQGRSSMRIVRRAKLAPATDSRPRCNWRISRRFHHREVDVRPCRARATPAARPASLGYEAGIATPDEQPEEVNPELAEVRVGENETFESALRRFNKKIQQSGILAEARRREHYEKPSVKRKRKEAKRKKNARTPQG